MSQIFLKGYFHRRENSKYLLMPLAIAICEDRYFSIEIASLSKNARAMSLE
jgi:hypothetical protein